MSFPTADERYVLRDDAPPNEPGTHPDYWREDRHFGVWDKAKMKWAMLPNATLLWGLTADWALDGLNEMRGRYRAESLRDE
jgi:hypothetical protein